MTKPTRDELKALLQESHRADQRAPAERAAGLDRLLEAEAAVPPKAPLKPLVPVLATVTLITAGAFLWWNRGAPPPAQVPMPRIPQIVSAPDAETIVLATPAPDAAVVLRPQFPTPRPRLPESDTLETELLMVEAAAAQLKTNASLALATLDGYDRAFPTGSMRREAKVLRVEVLVKLERREAAEALVNALMKDDPDGLLTRRLQGLLDAGAP